VRVAHDHTASRRRRALWVVAAIWIIGASCSLNTQGKDHCATNADCLRGATCVNRQCLFGAGADSSSGDDDASMPSPDGPSHHQDGSSDHQDGGIHQDASRDLAGDSDKHQDASYDLRDGSSDHQDASHDLRDGSNDHADASPEHDGDADGELGRHIIGTCDAGTVTECAGPTPNGQCQQTYCGGRLWLDGPQSLVGYIPYRIQDPSGLFSNPYKSAIRASATAWSASTGGLITFAECSRCTGRFISVVPGSGDGISNPQDWEELLPLPVNTMAPGEIPWHRIAHQWGHVIGLDDTYRRPDRDRYASFDPAVWCTNGVSLPATCAYSGQSQQPGSPPIASGTFGSYDELSVMNGLPSEGVCGKRAADPSSGQPTLGDVSAVEELYFGIDGRWAPFQPIARSVAANEPLNYELAPGVDPVGGPAIAESAAASVDIVVRGKDGKIYETWNDLSGTTFLDWADWTVVADHVDADLGLVFAGPNTLYLVVRSAVDGSIRLRTRTAGVWGRWGSLGAPSVGALSAPAIAAQDQQSLTVFARGGDNLIYQLECTDPVTMCAASAAAVDAWTALPASDVGGFLGKPSAAWMADGSGLLMVTAIGVDHAAWIIGPAPNNWGGWLPLHISVSPEDPDPGVALASNAGLGQLNYFTRDENGLLHQKIDSGAMFELGGMPISTPGTVGTARGDLRVDVVALIDDHGHPGVWWKFLSTQNTPPCNYNAPGTCAQCGCGLPGDPRCDF
jgi:hypothetical protein